jgi:hypothetical protein
MNWAVEGTADGARNIWQVVVVIGRDGQITVYRIQIKP